MNKEVNKGNIDKAVANDTRVDIHKCLRKAIGFGWCLDVACSNAMRSRGWSTERDKTLNWSRRGTMPSACDHVQPGYARIVCHLHTKHDARRYAMRDASPMHQEHMAQYAYPDGTAARSAMVSRDGRVERRSTATRGRVRPDDTFNLQRRGTTDDTEMTAAQQLQSETWETR